MFPFRKIFSHEPSSLTPFNISSIVYLLDELILLFIVSDESNIDFLLQILIFISSVDKIPRYDYFLVIDIIHSAKDVDTMAATMMKSVSEKSIYVNIGCQIMNNI